MAGSRRLQIEIIGDSKGLSRAFGETESKLGSLSKSIGKGGLLIAGALGTAALAGGAALVSIGTTFDTMSDTIRVGTGATGAELKRLEESAKRVGTSVPASFDDVGTAIADLNTRTGLVGPQLEGMAGQFLELSRITGTDLTTAIESGTRLFGDWSISAEDMPGTMDALFRASQETGVGFDALSQNMVKFGAPMRQLGFSFEETAGLLGKFEKEGVNSSLVMGSMRIALGKMAKAGEPAEETLTRVTDEIANAGSASEANALALELFGSKAGPDMAAAIREGRFELGDLLGVIEGGSETIMGAADDTADWQEQWQLLKNKGMVAFAPLAQKAFGALGDGMEKAGPHLEAFGEWMSVKLPVAMAATQEWIETKLIPAFEKIAPFLVEIWEKYKAYLAVVWPAIMTGIGLVAAWVEENWPQISATITTAMEAIKEIVTAVIDAAVAAWEMFGDNILDHVERVWPLIQQQIQGALDVITGIFQLFTAILQGDWGAAWDALKLIVSGAWDVITAMIGIAIENAKTVIGAGWEFLTTITDDLATTIVDAIKAIPGKLLGLLFEFLGAGYSLGAAILDGFANALAAGAAFAGDIAAGVVSAVKTAINTHVIGRLNAALEFDVSLGPLGSFTVDPPNIPMLAAGGVVTGPTLALVGEGRESEAVLPLSKLDAMLANGGGGDVVHYITVQIGDDPIMHAVERSSHSNGGARILVRAGG